MLACELGMSVNQHCAQPSFQPHSHFHFIRTNELGMMNDVGDVCQSSVLQLRVLVFSPSSWTHTWKEEGMEERTNDV